MLKNYLKIAFRTIYKNKIFSFINIIGLAIGLGCSILIMIYVLDELGIDQYHKNIDLIYQVNLKWIGDGKTGYQTTVAPSIAGILQDEYTDIINVVRTGNLGEAVLKTNDKMIVEPNGIAADPSILRIFTFPLLEGDISTVLREPHSIVLTESTAKKYFGGDEALGKIIRINNKYDMLVTGVMKDLPHNSSQKFDFVVPFSFLKDLGYEIEGTRFFPCSYSTFVVLKKNVSYKSLSDRIEKSIFFNGNNISFSICLLPFKDAYLSTTNGITKITILSLIAFFILILACINFTNLTTACSTLRRKEIVIRKVVGAGKFQLSKQFLIESNLLVVISAVISLLLTNEFLILLNSFTGKSLSIPFTNPVFILSFAGLIFVTGIFAGIYPAIYLPIFRPVEIFHKRFSKQGKSILRKALIVFQFSLSIAFVVCTFVMSKQINFVHNFNMGINKYNIVYVSLEGDIHEKYDLVKTELLKNPNIIKVTSASDLPHAIVTDVYTNWGRNDNIPRKIYTTNVGYDYLKTFGLQMSAGRFYSKDYPSDVKGSIVVNEAAVKELDMKAPIGKPFFFLDANYTLIGTIKDFHYNKLLNSVPEPLAVILKPYNNKYLFAGINPNIKDISQITETKQYVQDICNRFSPERPLQSKFLSDYSFDEERSTEVMREIVLYSTILALLISCLGLFGLSMLISRQRTKEIGIRKTLGASVPGIVVMLSKEFLLWVLIANLIAWPAAYFAMNKWLQNYAYKTDLGLWIFVLSGAMAFVIALLTVSFQAIKAAAANPVESLKYE